MTETLSCLMFCDVLLQHVMKFAEMTQEVKIARSELIQLDSGLTPGRRRLAQKKRDEAERLGAPVEAMLYSLGPPFPLLEVTKPLS